MNRNERIALATVVALLLVSRLADADYMGCYTDDSDRALPNLLGDGYTVGRCIDEARGRGYCYAGLQWYGQCWAGNDLRYAHVSDAECDTPCTADPTQTCGGAYRNSIYSTGACSPSFPSGYQGCFTDDPNRALPVFYGTGHSIESCRQSVRNAGYAYAGLQNRGECWGGNYLLYARVLDDECNAPCDANPSQRCGGTWRNSIYESNPTLSANRDRLFSDLAARKGINKCDLWANMIGSERFQFMVQTAVLGSPQAYIYPQPNPNRETLLDHATSLFSINGPRPGCGSCSCGGVDYDRIFLGFDAIGTWANRNYQQAGGDWEWSFDPAGPHDPFNKREDIRWGTCWFVIQNGPTRHHWGSDGDRRSLCGRLGVGTVTDPSIAEVTTSFTCGHDSDPYCFYGDGWGFDTVQRHTGPAYWSWKPSGCPPTPAAANYTYAGLGPPGCL